MAKQDKFNKPFLPGQVVVERQERDNKKAKVRAKKVRKASSVGAVSFVFEEPSAQNQKWRSAEDMNRKFREEYTQAVDIETVQPMSFGTGRLRTRDKQGRDVQFGDLLDVFFSTSQRTFDELAEEFEGLMSNHDRLMSHFRGI